MVPHPHSMDAYILSTMHVVAHDCGEYAVSVVTPLYLVLNYNTYMNTLLL